MSRATPAMSPISIASVFSISSSLWSSSSIKKKKSNKLLENIPHYPYKELIDKVASIYNYSIIYDFSEVSYEIGSESLN